MTDKAKRAIRNFFKRGMDQRFDRLAVRASVKTMLDARNRDGRAYIQIWQRDCDLAEGTELREIPANVPAFVRLENETYDNAEGPVSIAILTPEEADGFVATFRDRAAEAAGY